MNEKIAKLVPEVEDPSLLKWSAGLFGAAAVLKSLGGNESFKKEHRSTAFAARATGFVLLNAAAAGAALALNFNRQDT